MAKRRKRLKLKIGKKGLSVHKLSNIYKNKLAKQGKIKKKRTPEEKNVTAKKKKLTFSQQQASKKRHDEKMHQLLKEEELTANEIVDMLDPGELEYLLKTEGKTSSTSEEATAAETTEEGEKGVKRTHGDLEIDDENEEEAEYEKEGPRDFVKAPPGKRVRQLLPIKMADGSIQQQLSYEDSKQEQDEDSGVGAEEEEEEGEEKKSDDESEDEEKNIRRRPRSVVEMMVNRRKKLEEKKTRIGSLAHNFLIQPEDRIRSLTSLVQMMKEDDPMVMVTVRKYAAVTLLEVFRTIVPAYSINVEEEKKQRMKKETLRLYNYERLLLQHYKQYLVLLEEFLRPLKRPKDDSSLQQLSLVSLRCLGELFTRHSHFNYTTNLIHAIVPFLDSRSIEARKIVSEAITKIFKSDTSGSLSLEVAKQIDKLVRSRRFYVKSETLSVLLSLRLSEAHNADEKEDDARQQRRQKSKQERIMKKLRDKKAKVMSNKETKDNKVIKQIEQQLGIASVATKTAKRNANHTQIVQIIFGFYIHILKRNPHSKLMDCVLEGLAKFAHLINVEFFGDLLNVLSSLMETKKLTPRGSLHCIHTVGVILSGQGEALAIDPRRFYSQLYRAVPKVTAASENTAMPLLGAVSQMLLNLRRRAGPSRVAAFAKRLACMVLSSTHSVAIPTLHVLRSLMIQQKVVQAMLDTDGEGSSGSFLLYVDEPEQANAQAATLWELRGARRHYQPTVKRFAEHLIRGAPLTGEGSLPLHLSKTSLGNLYEQHDLMGMTFAPDLPEPQGWLACRKAKQRTKVTSAPLLLHTDEMQKLVEIETKQEMDDVNFYSGANINLKQTKCSFSVDDVVWGEDITDVMLMER